MFRAFSAHAMFYRIALLRCSQLQGEIGGIFSELAASPIATREAAAEWKGRASTEATRARVLRAAAELAGALEEDGPFLVQAPVDLRHVERVIDVAKRRLGSATDVATARKCVEGLESMQHAEMVEGLLEVAETEFCRVLRLIGSELKAVRRLGLSTRPADTRKARRLCA
jgi:hypothetical protein